jgi:hypothetical protein
MRLPNQNAAYQHRVRFGRYVTRRLKQAEFAQLSASAEAATQDVKQKGRAWEDCEEFIQDALADRDGGDAKLDHAAQTSRLTLAARSLDASKQSPYTDIFPDGIEYYTASPLPENPKRYGELLARLEKFLLPGDAVGDDAIPKLKTLISTFVEALKAVEEARTRQAIAASSLANAEELWARQMERIYGALIEQIGKSKAEKFFPAARTNRANEEAE